MIDELNDIKSLHCGNYFRKVDLHVHSPASGDTSWGEINEYDFLKFFEDAGFELIAVTDHNTGEWIDKVMKAAKAQRKRNKWKLCIIPGVEVSASGIHLVILFPENTNSSMIDHFLSQLQVEPSDRGKDAMSKLSPLEVCEIAHKEEFNGIVIGAHCSSPDNGIVGSKTRSLRKKTLEALDILELKATSDNHDKTIKYVRENLGFTDMPFIYSSDAHRSEEICGDTCWLKMDNCSFNGVKQITLEPHLRWDCSPPSAPSHPHILGISVVGGLYAGQQIPLNSGLNVIIGGRGAGKSALFELIRFVFGNRPKLAEDEKLFINRITSFLNIGDKVRLFLSANDKEYVIERVMSYEESGPKSKRTRELDSDPTIYDVTTIEPLRLEGTPLELFPVEIFAQGEVFGLTKRVEDQRKLIDDYIGTEPYLAEEKKVISELMKNSDIIIKTQALLDRERAKVEDRDEIQGRITELEKHTKDEIFQEHEKWEAEKRFFNTSLQREQELNELSEEVSYKLKTLPKVPEKTPNAKQIAEYANLYGSLMDDLKSSERELQKLINGRISSLISLRQKWQAKYDEESKALAEKLKELGVSDRAVIFKELQSKKTILKTIDEEVIPKINELEKELEERLKTRQDLLAKLTEVRQKLTTKRLDLIKSFNSQLANTVKIAIDTESDPDQFIEKLNDMYSNSGIRNRDRIWSDLIDNEMTPMKLGEIILNKDMAALESEEISSDAVSKIVNHPTTKQVHELQIVKMEDVPEISLKKEGEYDFTSLEELSFGEKCSAMLSIVMLNKDTPLIIDQPEDELDHAFITENVVETIRKIKCDRQLLISTHNPNIPVLGDAELVIKVKKLPRTDKCSIERARGLEDEMIIEHLKVLEGGPEALQKRSQKYGLRIQG